MRHLGEERPQREHERRAHPSREIEHGAAVRPPLEMRLDGDTDDDVPVERRWRGQGEVGRRPDDLALVRGVGLEACIGPGEAEVVELFRIYARERPGRPELTEVSSGRGRRFCRVVPAGERHDQDGLAEPVRLFEKHQGVGRRHGRFVLLAGCPTARIPARAKA